jgi:hypothetical protein
MRIDIKSAGLMIDEDRRGEESDMWAYGRSMNCEEGIPETTFADIRERVMDAYAKMVTGHTFTADTLNTNPYVCAAMTMFALKEVRFPKKGRVISHEKALDFVVDTLGSKPDYAVANNMLVFVSSLMETDSAGLADLVNFASTEDFAGTYGNSIRDAYAGKAPVREFMEVETLARHHDPYEGSHVHEHAISYEK